MGFLSLVYIPGLPGLRTLPKQPGVIPNSRHDSATAQFIWEPLLKCCSPGYNCCCPSWPHHTEAKLPFLRDVLFPSQWSWHLSLCCICHRCHLRRLPMLPWHHAVLQNRSTGAFSSDTSKTPSFFRNKSMSVHAFMQWPTE